MATENVNKKCKKNVITPRDKLVDSIKGYFESISIEWNDEYLNDLPKKWKIFDDLVLLPFSCFTNNIWYQLSKKNRFTC